MGQQQDRSNSLSLNQRARVSRLDAASLLFLVSAFLAPWDLSLGGTGFTAYDAVLLVVASLTFVTRRRLLFLPLRYMVMILVFFLFAVLSTVRAPQPIESLTQILQFAFIFFVQIPVILTLIDSPVMFRLSMIFFLGGMLVGLSSAAAFERFQGAGRALVFYSSNPNRLGYTTAYVLPFALYLILDVWQRRRFLAIVLALPILYLMIWALAASGSRSSTVGTLVAAVVFLAFRRGFHANLRTLARLALTLVVVALLCIWFYQSSLFPATLRQRIELTFAEKASLTQDRIGLAEAGWLAFLESPLVGVGFDNFRYVAGQYVFGTHQVPHNMWIQFLAQIGLVGMLAFAIVIVEWFAEMFQAQRATTDRSRLGMLWAFIASYIAILTIYLFVPLPIQREYWLVFGLGLALAHQSYTIAMQSAAAPDTDSSVRRWGSTVIGHPAQSQ